MAYPVPDIRSGWKVQKRTEYPSARSEFLIRVWHWPASNATVGNEVQIVSDKYQVSEVRDWNQNTRNKHCAWGIHESRLHNSICFQLSILNDMCLEHGIFKLSPVLGSIHNLPISNLRKVVAVIRISLHFRKETFGQKSFEIPGRGDGRRAQMCNNSWKRLVWYVFY